MQFHEAANIFPLLEEKELQELRGDIEKHGQRDTIVLCDGKILDGRNRYTACTMAGIKPRCKDVSELDGYDADAFDPVAYVLSLNLHRRHLTVSQASMCAARARDLWAKRAEEAKERQKQAGKEHGRGKEKVPHNCAEPINKGETRKQIARDFGVSHASVDRARLVQENGIPEVAAAVDAGKISVNRACSIVANPKDMQQSLLEVALQAKRGAMSSKAKPREQTEPDETPKRTGKPPVGVILANEALNVLMRIPKHDSLRKRGFQIVTDWIRANP